MYAYKLTIVCTKQLGYGAYKQVVTKYCHLIGLITFSVN